MVPLVTDGRCQAQRQRDHLHLHRVMEGGRPDQCHDFSLQYDRRKRKAEPQTQMKGPRPKRGFDGDGGTITSHRITSHQSHQSHAAECHSNKNHTHARLARLARPIELQRTNIVNLQIFSTLHSPLSSTFMPASTHSPYGLSPRVGLSAALRSQRSRQRPLILHAHLNSTIDDQALPCASSLCTQGRA